jgi:mannose-1-phosphate guanylyltransferase
LNTVRALILAAGLGTRLRPLTDATPKCLLPLAGRPLLDFWMDALARAGVREALINTHALADQVRAYLDVVNRRGGMQLREFYEPALLGSAGTIAANPDFADGADQIVIVYADNLSEVRLDAMLEFHRGHDDPFTMLLFHAPNPQACGIAELDSRNRIVAFTEKPAQPKSDLANAGVYVVDAAAYREIAALQGFDIGFDVLPKFVGRMRGWPLRGFHLDIGTPAAYERAQAEARRIVADRGFDSRGRRRAVFLDRDGTLIEHVPYLADPAQVRLLPGAADAVRKLRAAGYATVVVTNQSAIGRGLLDYDRLREIHDEMCSQLAREGAVLDALYDCPTVPVGDDRTQIEDPNRKPGPGMLLRAAAELSLDLSRSWMIGDMISDALAGFNAGCLGSILVESDKTIASDAEATRFPRVADITAAAETILAHREDHRNE